MLDSVTSHEEPDSAPDATGRPLRSLRMERLLAIRDLARLARVSPATISDIETGTLSPGPRTIRRIAAALRVAPEDIAEFRPEHARVDPDVVAARIEAMGYPRALAMRVARTTS